MEVVETHTIDENSSLDDLLGEPYKIQDYHGLKRVGIVAKDLNDLMTVARNKLDIPEDTPIRVVLEQDGTEVEDEDYFSTLEKNTAFIILVGDQKWLPSIRYSRSGRVSDELDGDGRPAPHLEKLVDQLYSDLTCVTLLGGKELEMLASMNPECMADLFPHDSRFFFDSLKEASVRFLTEKEQAREAMDLLKVYHSRHVSAQRKKEPEK